MRDLKSDFLKIAEAVSSVRKQEVPLPIAKVSALVTPLMVGDDISLRSSLMSPANYDKELVKLLHKHTEIIRNDDGERIKPNLGDFLSTLSNVDKICLLWGLFKATYDVLGKRSFTCDNDECKSVFKEEISLDSLINDETFQTWDEEVPFFQFSRTIEVNYLKKFLYSFKAKLPSIGDNNRILSLVSVDSIQRNLETTGDMYAKSERLTLLVNEISIRQMDEPDKVVASKSMHEILVAFQKYIPFSVADEFMSRYSEIFSKYVPKFSTSIKCPNCQKEMTVEVDLETEFFRRILFSGEQKQEKL